LSREQMVRKAGWDWLIFSRWSQAVLGFSFFRLSDVFTFSHSSCHKIFDLLFLGCLFPMIRLLVPNDSLLLPF